MLSEGDQRLRLDGGGQGFAAPRDQAAAPLPQSPWGSWAARWRCGHTRAARAEISTQYILAERLKEQMSPRRPPCYISNLSANSLLRGPRGSPSRISTRRIPARSDTPSEGHLPRRTCPHGCPCSAHLCLWHPSCPSGCLDPVTSVTLRSSHPHRRPRAQLSEPGSPLLAEVPGQVLAPAC